MKKITWAVLSALFCLSLVACGMRNEAEAGGNYKLGLAAYTHRDGSKTETRDSDEKDRICTTYVALLLDGDGKIVKASIDEVESEPGFDGSGSSVDGKTGEIKSKKELGSEYNMRPYSLIGKEWYEQIETLENWLVGKNIRDIVSAGLKNIPADSDSKESKSEPVNSNSGGRDSISPDGRTEDGGVLQWYDGTQGVTVPGEVIEDITDGINDMIPDGAEDYTGWMDEDLKAGVTIDTKYIYKAIQKAYTDAG